MTDMTPTPEREALAELESAFQFTNNRGIAVSAEWINGWEACLSYVRAALTSTTEATAEPAAVPVTDEMVTAYLTANDTYWRKTDELPKSLVKWRNGTVSEATRVSLRAALAAQGTQKADAAPVAEIIDANAGCNCLYERRIPKWLDGTPPVGTKLYATPQKAEATQAAAPTEDDIDTELAEHEVALTTEQRGGVHAAFRDLLAASQQGGRT